MIRRLKRRIKRLMRKVKVMFSVKIPVSIPVLYGELLKGRRALVTGGTSGIGYAIADAFLRNGADVILTGRDVSRIDAACDKLRAAHPDRNIDGVILDNRDILRMPAVLAEIFQGGGAAWIYW